MAETTKLTAFSTALDRLQEAIVEATEANRLSMDGTIQRFEFSFELAWKSFQEKLRFLGIEVNSPKAALRAAYAQKWIDDEEIWLEMLSCRNKSSHVYHEEMATQIFRSIKQFYPKMREAQLILAQ